MSNTKPIIMFDSPEAAQQKTLTGWVCRNGFFFGENEDAARYSGCTHRKCEDCDSITERSWTVCESCREKRDIARYAKRWRRGYEDGEILYSEAADQYFSDLQEVADHIYETNADKEEEDQPDITWESLRLVICEPNEARLLTEDYFHDELGEDGELPDELVAAMNAFNAVVEKCKPLSYSPGRYALDLASIRAEIERLSS